jgi:hypothetical protein
MTQIEGHSIIGPHETRRAIAVIRRGRTQLQVSVTHERVVRIEAAFTCRFQLRPNARRELDRRKWTAIAV